MYGRETSKCVNPFDRRYARYSVMDNSTYVITIYKCLSRQIADDLPVKAPSIPSMCAVDVYLDT